MKEHITKTIILDRGDPESKRQEILEYFRKTVAIEEKLYKTFITSQVFYLRADPHRHPLIFYFGHTAVFYINKLILAKLLNNRIDPGFESMFAIGVDEMSWDDLNETHYNWPDVEIAADYRKKVWKTVEKMILNLPLTLPITWSDPLWIILMGIEHQRIHLETSSVLIRQLPLEVLQKKGYWQICQEKGPAPTNVLIEVKSGTVKIGKAHSDPIYGWDNEYGAHEAEVDTFKASKFLVSNEEFKEFIEAGGYCKQEYWSEEGWQWKTYIKAKKPLFWRKKEDGYYLRLMLEEIPMPWNWPVELNYLEAKAFCNWKTEMTGKPIRLPSEDEWYLLRDSVIKTDQPFWDKAPGNINLEHYSSPCPVDKLGNDDFYDVIGNVWQWTETPIFGFDGFEVHPFYDDFSTPTFDMKHNLVKGGSWISTGNESTRDARYAFRRHFYQHAGFRYVESDKSIVISESFYENDLDVALRCEFNWGDKYRDIKNFPVTAAKFCLDKMGKRGLNKALNIGCDTGRTTFELARNFDNVTGIDFTARYIKIAIQMLELGKILYTLPEEGELVSFHEKKLSDYNYEDLTGKVNFWQADPSNMKDIFTGYDLIYVQNIIDRVYDPEKFLNSLPERLNSDGLLIISSDYDWQQEFTDQKKWLGGFRKDGEPVWSLKGLIDVLSRNFRQVEDPVDIDYIKRLGSRKFELRSAQFTVWKRI